MDRVDTINPQKDTTLMLMKEAFDRGHEVFVVGKQGVSRLGKDLHFHGCSVSIDLSKSSPISLGQPKQVSGNDVDCVFVRWDPPFDTDYYYNTLLLEFLPERVFVVNSPQGLRELHEKVWVTQFTDLTPRTLLSSNQAMLETFINDHQKVIAKPLHQYGGQSIFICEKGHANTPVIVETLSQNYTTPIILQAYISAASDGDKRILLLNGDPLGAVLRVHPENDHRNNFFAGGTAQKAGITANDLSIIDVLKPHLQHLGLYFVGIDIIGDKLIEVNVTSPTCLQEINRLNEVQLEKQIMDFVEDHRNAHVR